MKEIEKIYIVDIFKFFRRVAICGKIYTKYVFLTKQNKKKTLQTEEVKNIFWNKLSPIKNFWLEINRQKETLY